MENTVILNNGVQMPKIGYGVYQIPSVVTEKCVADAFSVGYRSIDTAQCYGNEKQVGKAVKKSGLARNEVFITTKLWGGRGYRDTVGSIDGSLKALGMDFIDLLLINEPTGDFLEIYRAMEDAYKAGKLRAIGVANFLEGNFRLLTENCTVIPAVNQVETHIFRQQKSLRKLLDEKGTVHESWSPLACGKNGFFKNPVLKELTEKHKKTTAQIGLRFLYQQDIVIIPKSTHIERMRENLDILDFELTSEEMTELKALDMNKSLFGWW
ncbi:MAG: aldo/keto reductase [Lachnospiraceae bacterium]|nr:aldo/keto reductase [Lachnospiraceae bacterium]MCM1230805.1 aldo/keto reductase [Ruminococcus flavefaciens]